MDFSRCTSQGLLQTMDWVKSATGTRLEIWLLQNPAYDELRFLKRAKFIHPFGQSWSGTHPSIKTLTSAAVQL